MKLDSSEMRTVRRALGYYMGGVLADLSTIESHNDPDHGNSAGAVLLADEERTCAALIEELGKCIEGEQ